MPEQPLGSPPRDDGVDLIVTGVILLDNDIYWMIPRHRQEIFAQHRFRYGEDVC
jgi:hypothetical protein